MLWRLMAVSMVPIEMWTAVLAELKDLSDFARAQAVSRTFHAIVLHKCWGQINHLHVSTSSMTILKVNRGEKKTLSSEKGLGLVKELARKAPHIKTLVLIFFDWNSTCSEIVDHLASASRKIQELELFLEPVFHNPFLQSSMAALFRSVAPTLNILKVEICQHVEAGEQLGIPPELKQALQLAIPPELQQAFDQCTSLESVKFVFYNTIGQANLAEMVLRGKTQLKSLDIFCGGPVERLSEAILSSGAHLLRFVYDVRHPEFFSLFKAEVERRGLSTHPLQSIKELTLWGLGGRSVVAVADYLDLFPQMDTLIYDSVLCEDIILADLVAKFLMENRNAMGGQKELQCLLHRFASSLRDFVAAVKQRVECRVEFRKTPTHKLISFSKGNAIVKFTLPIGGMKFWPKFS